MKIEQVTVDGEKWHLMRVPVPVSRTITICYLWKREGRNIRIVKSSWHFRGDPSKEDLRMMLSGSYAENITIPTDAFICIANYLKEAQDE